MREPGTNARPDWKLAVVVGAGGLGAVVARRLSQRHRILIADQDGDSAVRVAELLREEGGDVSAIACDITQSASVKKLAAAAESFGNIALLAHVVGLSPSCDDFERILRVNLYGAALVESAFLPLASRGMAAIFISSLAAHLFQPSEAMVDILRSPLSPTVVDDLRQIIGPAGAGAQIAYPLSKFGLMMMCRRQARAWGERQARILSLSPGMIATPMGNAEFDRSSGKRKLYQTTPLQRDGTMLEIADAVEFLASDRASFITGTDLLVDGGIAGMLSDRPGR